jgi:hypothetical protein
LADKRVNEIAHLLFPPGFSISGRNCLPEVTPVGRLTWREAMSKRTATLWFAFALALAFANPLCAEEVWKGVAKQNIGAQGYSVVLKLTGAGGESDYPELKCGGTLTRAGEAGIYSFYLEKITRKGTGCIDGAITLVRSSSGTIGWGWVGVHSGKTYAAWSSLTRE